MQFYKKWGGKWVWVWTWSFGDTGQTDASQPYGSNGLVTEATCKETSQQGWNCSTAQLLNEHRSEWFHGKFWRILKKLVWTNHSKAPKLERPNLAWGVIKFSKRVTSLTSARAMQSNLASALFTFGSSEVKKTGNGKKIRVQPNRKRKCGSGSQAVSKGRPVQLQEPTSKGKWSHDLAKAVQTNTISNKKSGSHAMKPKTKQIQWKKRKTRNLSE